MTVSIASSIVAAGGKRDHRDARDHDLVDALVAELDDRVDHLLLLGLEDPLLPALLDDQAQLLGADPFVGRDIGPEQPADPAGRPGQERHERAEEDAEHVDQAARRERDPLRVGQADLLGHELAEDDREDREQARDDHEGDRPGAPRKRPDVASQVAMPSTRLTAANAEARKPRKLIPIWMTARNRPGCSLSRRTRAAPPWPSSTSCWRRLRRSVTSAISVAEKTPLSRTSTTMIPSSR